MEEPSTFERYVHKNASVYHYMKISLVLENGNKYITDAQFKHLIICGLKDLYGEVGASFPFDLLKFDQNETDRDTESVQQWAGEIVECVNFTGIISE